MPISIQPEDTKLSFAYAVNKVQDSCRINRDEAGNRTDGIMKSSGKVVTRFVANTVLTLAALVETVVKALVVVVTLGFHDASKAALSLAGRTTLEALKGTLGFSTSILLKSEASKEVIEADVVTVTAAPTITEVEVAEEEDESSEEDFEETTLVAPRTWNENFLDTVKPAVDLAKAYPKTAIGAGLVFGIPVVCGVAYGALTFASTVLAEGQYVRDGIATIGSVIGRGAYSLGSGAKCLLVNCTKA